MFEGLTYPIEIILKPDAKRRLPDDMAAAGKIYLVEPVQRGVTFMRVCANPTGYGRHTTVPVQSLDLCASFAQLSGGQLT